MSAVQAPPNPIGLISVVFAVLRFADAPSLQRAHQVCAGWHELIVQRRLWARLCARAFTFEQLRTISFDTALLPRLDAQRVFRSEYCEWHNARSVLQRAHAPLRRRVFMTDTRVTSVSCSGSLLLTASESSTLALWDLESCQAAHAIETGHSHWAHGGFLDRLTVYSYCDADGELHVWSLPARLGGGPPVRLRTLFLGAPGQGQLPLEQWSPGLLQSTPGGGDWLLASVGLDRCRRSGSFRVRALAPLVASRPCTAADCWRRLALFSHYY